MSSLRRQFETQGFIVLEEALGPDGLTPLRQAIGEVVEDFDVDEHRVVFRTDDRDRGRDETFFASATDVRCFLEADSLDEAGNLVVEKERAINKIGHALHDRIPEFEGFCRKPLFGQLLREVGMREPLLTQTMYIFKQPRIGGEVHWHQDASYLITKPAGVVGIWIAMEDAHLENGCLWMAPGGHRSPLREIYEVDWSKREGHLRTLDSTPWPDQAEARPLELTAGSVVVFDDHMPHFSSRNTSAISRQALTLHAAERDAEWSECNWLQRTCLPPFAL